ncbi:MAG: hypothetical protein NT029_11615 [Armatimonadetes bacterium]|nr:hypothetical protein [Armatimonadota bacterium]
MQYSVIPFIPVVKQQGAAAATAAQLTELISKWTKEGWEYVRIETVRAVVTSGCFGNQATQVDYYMVVFRHN